MRSESKSLNGREGNQTENSAFSLHIYNIQILTHYSSSGFSPWALRDGENSLGINAFLRILKSVRTGQVMLCPSGHKPKRYCARRQTERQKERVSSQENRGEGGGDGGVRGRESAAASRVHAASCSGFSEALCLSESVKLPVRTRRPFCARPSGKAENSSGLCQRAKSLPSKHGLCACGSCRRTSCGSCDPGRLLGRTSAPPGRSPRSVAKSERVSFLREPLGSAPTAQRRAPRSSVLPGPG